MKDTQNLKIFEELKDFQRNYEAQNIQIVDGLYFSQYKTIKMCEFYANSTYLRDNTYRFGDKTTGRNKDDLGRDKPFYNIVNYRVSLAKTATDLDIKDINIISDNPKHWIKAMFLNKEVYNWMKKSNFSLTLNQMGYTRPKYGGYLAKKCYNEDDELSIEVVEWKNVATSQVDILGGPIVERHFMTPVALKKKEDVWDNINDVLRAHKKLDSKDRPLTIDVYEILGEFPISFYKQATDKEFTDADEYEYTLQKYIIANVGEENFKLHCEEQKGKKISDTYRYLPWETMSGRALGKGVIEDSEEAQVWINDAVINEKRAMDLAGRVGIKTNSKKLGNNILEHDFGKIYELGLNEDINSFNLAPSALGQFQNQIDKWKMQADDATNSYDANTGEQPPSGTPYSQTALLNQVASKPFDYRREEWGIELTQMFEEWIIPYIIKKLYKGHTLRSDYTDEELTIIDETIGARESKKFAIEQLLQGQVPTPEDMSGVNQQVNKELNKFGKARFIKFPDGYFDDVEAGVTVVTTGEQKNKAAMLQTLDNLLGKALQSYDPNTGKFAIFDDPRLSKIFGTIVENSQAGVTPASFGIGSAKAAPQAPTAPVAPQQSAPLATAPQATY